MPRYNTSSPTNSLCVICSAMTQSDKCICTNINNNNSKPTDVINKDYILSHNNIATTNDTTIHTSRSNNNSLITNNHRNINQSFSGASITSSTSQNSEHNLTYQSPTTNSHLPSQNSLTNLLMSDNVVISDFELPFDEYIDEVMEGSVCSSEDNLIRYLYTIFA